MKQPTLTGKYQLSTSIDIFAPQEKVWEVLKDFANVYSWVPSVKESYAIGTGSECVGAGRHCVLEGFGEIDEYITQWHNGSGFVYDVSPLGPLDQAFSCWWLTSPGKNVTRLTVTFAYELRFGLFGKIMHKLIMRSKLETSLPQALAALKTRVETGNVLRPLIDSSIASKKAA